MLKIRTAALVIFIAGLALGYFAFANVINPSWFLGNFGYRLGLDLQGGSHLVYKADVSGVVFGEVRESMEGLRDVIERRINAFGVAEPLVQVERSAGEERLIVELAGVFNIDEAVKLIGQTPYLEFKTERREEERDIILDAQSKGQRLNEDPYFISTILTGRYLKKSTLDFNPSTGEPSVLLEFDEEGGRFFAEITRENVGRRVAIFLDGQPISIPVVNEEIASGSAQISGQFTPDEAKALVRRLNSGALPVPIQLLSQQSVGPVLGAEVFRRGIGSAIYGILAVLIFLVLRYRLPGLISVLSLGFYIVLVLSVFKLLPVTLTAAGIAGFILSVGMAVDANILIFERMKEETRWGRDIESALGEGFRRALPSIRDSNISTLITASILYWFGASIVRGFALTLGLGVLASIFSALVVARTFLLAFDFYRGKSAGFLYGVGGAQK